MGPAIDHKHTSVYFFTRSCEDGAGRRLLNARGKEEGEATAEATEATEATGGGAAKRRLGYWKKSYAKYNMKNQIVPGQTSLQKACTNDTSVLALNRYNWATDKFDLPVAVPRNTC